MRMKQLAGLKTVNLLCEIYMYLARIKIILNFVLGKKYFGAVMSRQPDILLKRFILGIPAYCTY